jgi:hypothetical protein
VLRECVVSGWSRGPDDSRVVRAALTRQPNVAAGMLRKGGRFTPELRWESAGITGRNGAAEHLTDASTGRETDWRKPCVFRVDSPA